MFIWDFVAAKVLGQIVDWFYSQIVGFLGNFFSEMGNMGAELFTMDWVQSIVLFFSYLAWALYGTGLVVACFETGVEYSSGRGNIRETALNAIKGFSFRRCDQRQRGLLSFRGTAYGTISRRWSGRTGISLCADCRLLRGCRSLCWGHRLWRGAVSHTKRICRRELYAVRFVSQ